ncbi:hypothetical protein ABTZ46_30230, partial [Nocardioides sp. NPDC126508]
MGWVVVRSIETSVQLAVSRVRRPGNWWVREQLSLCSDGRGRVNRRRPGRLPGYIRLVLLTLTSTPTPQTPDATALSYLLHKHPDRVQSFDLA